MVILVVRTDKEEAELYLYEDQKQLAELKWKAHRELASTIHIKINEILNMLSISLEDIEGMVCFKGPGSFTGLRIGLSVANALACSLNIPVVARSGDDWLQKGIKDLLAGKSDKIAIPKYGAPAKTTKPKK